MDMPDNEVKQLNYKMDRILFILNNDEGTRQPGLVSRFAALELAFENFVKQYDKDQAFKRGKNAVWTMVFGAVGSGIAFFIKYIIFK